MKAPDPDGLPRLLEMSETRQDDGRFTASMPVTAAHLAPIGRLHAGSAITLADTACGYGCLASLPDEAAGFATTSISTHLVGTADVGDTLTVEAALLHAGRTTQLWAATVSRASDGRTVAELHVLQQLLG